MTETGCLRTGDAEIARNPAAEMTGVGSDDAILWQNFVHRNAQGTRVDDLRVRLIRVWTAMVIARTDALARAVIAAARCCARHAKSAKLSQQGPGGRFRVAEQSMLHRHLVAQLRRLDIDLRDAGAGRDQLR